MGETGKPLYMGVNGHQYDIAHWRNEASPVAEYFNSGAHVELDRLSWFNVRSRDACLRKISENRWIRTLGTSSPLGMNLRVDSL